jgi:hypothetical protein
MIKREIAKARALAACEAFEECVTDFNSLSADEQLDYKFELSKQSVKEGLKPFFKLFEDGGVFNKPSFQASVAESFVSVGCAPIDGDVKKGFKQYNPDLDFEKVLLPIPACHIPEDIKTSVSKAVSTAQFITAIMDAFVPDENDDDDDEDSSDIIHHEQGDDKNDPDYKPPLFEDSESDDDKDDSYDCEDFGVNIEEADFKLLHNYINGFLEEATFEDVYNTEKMKKNIYLGLFK